METDYAWYDHLFLWSSTASVCSPIDSFLESEELVFTALPGDHCGNHADNSTASYFLGGSGYSRSVFEDRASTGDRGGRSLADRLVDPQKNAVKIIVRCKEKTLDKLYALCYNARGQGKSLDKGGF